MYPDKLNQSSVSGNYSSPAGLSGAKAIRESEIQKELSHLENALGELLKKLDQLAIRLSPVLRNGNDKGEQIGTPEPSLVSLADTIRARRKEVDKAILILNSLTERIEI